MSFGERHPDAVFNDAVGWHLTPTTQPAPGTPSRVTREMIKAFMDDAWKQLGYLELVYDTTTEGGPLFNGVDIRRALQAALGSAPRSPAVDVEAIGREALEEAARIVESCGNNGHWTLAGIAARVRAARLLRRQA